MAGLVRLRRGIVPAVIAALALACAATALAAVKSHKVNVTATATALTSAGNVVTVVGTVTGKPLAGEGAVVYRVTPAANGQLAAKFTVFDKRGSFKGTALATSTPGPNGSSTLTGTGKATGGTGTYAGAKGNNLKLTGGSASDTAPLIIKVTGTIKY